MFWACLKRNLWFHPYPEALLFMMPKGKRPSPGQKAKICSEYPSGNSKICLTRCKYPFVDHMYTFKNKNIHSYFFVLFNILIFFFFSGKGIYTFVHKPDLVHNCEGDILLCKRKVGHPSEWTRVRPIPKWTSFSGPFVLCRGKDLKIKSIIYIMTSSGELFVSMLCSLLIVVKVYYYNIVCLVLSVCLWLIQNN